MQIKIWIATSIILVVSFTNIFELFSNHKTVEPMEVSKFNYSKNDTFASWFTQYDEKKPRGRDWGLANFKKEKPLVKSKPKPKKKKTIKVVQKKNLLCIDKSCYRLLAIKKFDDDVEVIFYNKALKKKLTKFKNNDLVEQNIFIHDISSSSVVLKELNTNRSWKFTMFDVDKSKYIPKGKK